MTFWTHTQATVSINPIFTAIDITKKHARRLRRQRRRSIYA